LSIIQTIGGDTLLSSSIGTLFGAITAACDCSCEDASPETVTLD